MSIVVVNSTVKARREMVADCQICPIHYWGYTPEKGDLLLCHKLSRFSIVFRHKIGGLDLPILARTIVSLRNRRGLYLVTQPDLISALPLLRWLYPRKRIVTWVWTVEETQHWKQFLKHADWVFSLTEEGLEGLEQIGLGKRSSLGHWGAPPRYFLAGVEEPSFDLLYCGIANRDVELIRKLVEVGSYRLVTTPKSAEILSLSPITRFTISNATTEADLLAVMHSAKICLIPLLKNDPNPSGYTNLVEALLSGTAVVIADTSKIPGTILKIKGVFTYEAENYNSFTTAINLALKASESPNFRSEVRTAASEVLNGSRLNKEICANFGLNEQAEWTR